ncbi:transferrin-binding protein-like solute binding protein [uncultured Psychrobacter sp.]|uniref:transferrin-binding protein-like solute binding protein n=1 Tax=uncultured Psychrobacter sp. TaxID=259303 RepID=UPI00259547CE|nr:transferrin-binding protein-like solute binding protein [uncultured Psychrobacter sp.]
MSPNRHSISAVSTAKKLKTPLKASVVLLTSMILAACNTTDDPSYNLDDVFSPIPGATEKQLEEAKAEAEKAKQEAQEAKEEAEKAKKEAAEQIAAAEKAAEEKAASALKAKEEAEAAAAAAEKAKADAIKAKEEAEQALEDALAGGGNKEELQAEADRLAGLADEAEASAQIAEQAQAQADEQATQAQAAANEANQVLTEAIQNAAIQNDAEAAKSGAQHVRIDASALSIPVATTTTRNFDIRSSSDVDARGDLATSTVQNPIAITVSGDDDADTQNGFKAHNDTTDALASDDLTYTATYKDFGDDELRIAHIDGTVSLGPGVPVNGVAVVGNATQVDNVPTEGTVGYTGDATYRTVGSDSAIEYGSSVFTADFVAKNVNGTLTFANRDNIGLSANISGNEFSGSSNGYNTEGGFYGGDAQYLGGIYEGNNAQGTFGAKSDDQTQAEADAQTAQQAAAASQAELDDAQAAAEQARATADEAQATAERARAAAERAQKRVDNAGGSIDEQELQDALDRAEEAEEAAKKAKEDADAAIQAAADKAQEEVKAAQDKVTAAQSEASAAKASAAAAVAAAEAAEKDAAAKIAAAKSAAAEDVAAAKKLADEARLEAEKAKTAKEKAEKEAQEAEDRATAAAEAQAAAEKQAQELQEQLDALTPKFESAAEAEQSGVQHLSVDASALKMGVKTTTTRDFEIRSTSDVDARADLALTGVLPGPITIQVSGANDTDTENGFKAYEGTASVLGEGDLAYTSIYKDFGDNDEMRIAHIDGAVTAGGGASTVPVDGVAVVGNKTVTLPTEGTFEYAGDATNRKVGVDNAIEYGSSEFTADFVNSKVDGTLKFAKTEDIILSANIGGEGTAANEFSGEKSGYNTEGAFYGEDANFIGGIYEGNGSQGTFGAEKDGTPADLVDPTPVAPENPNVDPDSEVTGFQSFTLSNADAIGFREFWDDNDNKAPEDGTDPEGDGSFTNTNDGNNFANDYQNIVARADLTKANTVLEPVSATIATDNDADYAGGNGFKNYEGSTSVQTNVVAPPLTLDYNSVYKNFDSQMQIGHIYGDAQAFGTIRSARVSSVYVEGNLTDTQDMTYLKELAKFNVDNSINDGTVNYVGNATYMDNLHFSSADPRPEPTVNGVSNFNVDFINDSLTGSLEFDNVDNIAISASINGNTFAGTNADNNVQTSGGFYGADAQYLGGIYQQALQQGGSGTEAGTGTTFQGTFGAEKQ